MVHKISKDQKYGNSHISILYPGKAIQSQDSGIGSIGRIDQADIQGGTTIRMHPHINDEILSYFRVGAAIHTDSAGITETISRKKLMLMKAGKVFYHEERIGDRLEGLQIFIRPMTADYEPEVLFYDLEPEDSLDAWRMLASNRPSSPLRFTSETEIHDLTLEGGEAFRFPETEIENAVYILYVFQGNLSAHGNIELAKGESLFADESGISFSSAHGAEVVLFITNQDQRCFKNGMYSGNQM
jgi:hypothetical protein